MYIALYDDNLEHIDNVTNVTYELTQRVYDMDTFSAEGVCTENVNYAKLAILNEDSGNYVYSCFVDYVNTDYDRITIKGLDFKALWDTEILIDYTQPDSFNNKLSYIFEKIKTLVFNGKDSNINKIANKIIIPNDETNTQDIYGTYQGTYIINNAYNFLKCYLKYYGYNIESRFDIVNRTIIFEFIKTQDIISINLTDFIYNLTTSSVATNKAIATLKWEEKEKSDGETESETLKPRPENIVCKYYYIDKVNNIVQSDEQGNIVNRIYPIKAKIFEDTDISKAVYSAIYELANSRYVDNISIDNNEIIDPIDLSKCKLYTKIKLYYDGKLYKTLPISEKNITLNENGLNTKIKLGFKKTLLTEIIKEQKS